MNAPPFFTPQQLDAGAPTPTPAFTSATPNADSEFTPARAPLKIKTKVLCLMLTAGGLAFLIQAGEAVLARAFVLQRLVVAGDAAPAFAARLHPMLAEWKGGNTLLMDINAVQTAASSLNGVKEARVRRLLPNGLRIDFFKHRPLARFADGGLISVTGEHYRGAPDKLLPIFKGDAARGGEMAEFYAAAARALAPANLKVAQVELQKDGQWRVFLQNGAVLAAGRENLRARLRRFAEMYPALRARFGGITHADLRYRRGAAILPQAPQSPPQQQSRG